MAKTFNEIPHTRPQTPLLDTVSAPADLRHLDGAQLETLADELRAFILYCVGKTGGHFGAGLGVTELTIALHHVFNTPDDRLVWDVGHQAYGHKILTGRRDQFSTNRKYKGLSGFPNRSESEYDTFGVGHSSTSISAALGMAIASTLKGETEKQHIAVIGDASIASGMAFEALNHAGVSNANLLIILNDNAIGIDPSVGALKEYLTKVKTDKSLAKNNIIRALNFDYSGPIDGHDLNSLLKELTRLKNKKGPKFLHVITTKGKGLDQAEKDQVKYHAPGKFDAKTGKLVPKSTEVTPPKYQDVFGKTIVELAEKNKKIFGITPAMPSGSSLKFMMDEMPDRAFDVGICEQHAVTLSAGMATQGLKVFCNIYSTFMQRAYDQVVHDVAIQKLPVVFCLDRAGLVGDDGPTHHGVYDIPYMRCIPNMIVSAPMNEAELRDLMYTAQLETTKLPFVIRYPRGEGMMPDWKTTMKEIEIGKGRKLKEGKEIAILSFGHPGNFAAAAIRNLMADGITPGHYDMRFAKPLDEEMLHEVFSTYNKIITVEDGTVVGGIGSAILEFMADNGYKADVRILGIPDRIVEHGSQKELHKECHYDAEAIATTAREMMKAVVSVIQ